MFGVEVVFECAATLSWREDVATPNHAAVIGVRVTLPAKSWGKKGRVINRKCLSSPSPSQPHRTAPSSLCTTALN